MTETQAIEQLIEPASPPWYARTRERGVELWTILEGYLATRADDERRGLPVEATIDITARAYRISTESVRAVLAYYADHKAAIDAYLEVQASA